MLVLACAPKNLWQSEPSIKKVSNTFFDASISPVYRFDGYKGFLLNVHNKTSENMLLEWKDTYYIHAGKKEGQFWFEGKPDVKSDEPLNMNILAGDAIVIEIYPVKLRTLSQIAGAYVHENMDTGENGVYLTVKVQGKPVSETMTLVFSQQ
jgi:hypothetical protein